MSSEIDQLVVAMQQQTKAINHLVSSNQQVIALLTEVVEAMSDDVEEDSNASRFLDGSPVNGEPDCL